MTDTVSKKSVVAWCFYDWANSAFPTIVLTFIFATYFTQSVAKTPLRGTEQWGDAIAVSGILIAIMSPILGAIADHQGRRKPWLACCTGLLVVSAFGLWWIQPNPQYAVHMLIFLVLGVVALEVGTVFYNAMLQSIAPANHIGRISGWAWGFGYAGGLSCLIIALLLFITPRSASWLNHSLAEQVRICGPFVALWLFIFSLPLFIWTPDSSTKDSQQVGHLIRRALATLWQTLRTLPHHRAIFLFLIAHMLYIDGLNTLFAFGGIYAAGTFGLTLSQVLLFGIGMNVTAGLGAAGFAWLDDLWGAKPTILVSLLLLVTVGVSVLLVRSVSAFVCLSFILGLFVGPVQAASRSLMVRLAPPHLVTELFGLYAFSGKATAFLNPWLVGMLTVMFHSQRVGMVSVMLFMAAGGLLLLRVKP